MGRQLIAAAIMAAALLAARDPLLPWFAGSVVERALSVLALVLAGVVVYFGAAWTIGAIDRDRLAIMQRKKALKNMRVLSGITPTGHPTLGTYLGPIRKCVGMQDT